MDLRRGKYINKVSLIVVSLLMVGTMVIGCSNKEDIYKQMIGVTIPEDSTIIRNEDTHGGFHGDGDYFGEIQLTEEGSKEFIISIEETGQWSKEPLSDGINHLLFGGEYNGPGVNSMQDVIPNNITNAIYFVRDRFAETYPEDAETNMLERGAYNFTIAVFDLDTNKLYIYEMDT